MNSIVSLISGVLLDLGPKPPLEFNEVLRLPIVQGAFQNFLLYVLISIPVLAFILYRTLKGHKLETTGPMRFIVPTVTLLGGTCSILGGIYFSMNSLSFFGQIIAGGWNPPEGLYLNLIILAILTLQMLCGIALVLCSIYALYSEVRKGSGQKVSHIKHLVVPLFTLVPGFVDLVYAMFYTQFRGYYPYNYAGSVLRPLGWLFLLGGIVLIVGSIYVLYRRLKK